MDKKLDSPAGRAPAASRPRDQLDQVLHELYTAYGEGEASAQLEALAEKLGTSRQVAGAATADRLDCDEGVAPE